MCACVGDRLTGSGEKYLSLCWCVMAQGRSSVSRRGTCRPHWNTSCGGSPRTLRESTKSRPSATRSEEHTSELQSRLHLVCRLLLEKKKIYDQARHILASSSIFH